MKKAIFHNILVLLTIITNVSTYAQLPYSITQNWLTGVNFETCMQRSREAMTMKGFSAALQVDNISYVGYKQNYSAYMICQACNDKTITTIVVHSSGGSEDVNVLREQMLYYIATGKISDNNNPRGNANLYTIKNVFSPGEKIIVEFNNLAGNSADWINIVPKGSSDASAGNWQYTNGQKSGRLTFDALPAGEYETRAFYNNSYKVEYRYNFSVGGSITTGGGGPVTGRLLKLDRSQFAVNEKIEVQFFNLAGNSADWINIVPKGTQDTSPGNWQYTNGQRSGRLTFNGLAAGEYEVRVFYNNSYTVEDRIQFKVQ